MWKTEGMPRVAAMREKNRASYFECVDMISDSARAFLATFDNDDAITVLRDSIRQGLRICEVLNAARLANEVPGTNGTCKTRTPATLTGRSLRRPAPAIKVTSCRTAR